MAPVPTVLPSILIIFRPLGLTDKGRESKGRRILYTSGAGSRQSQFRLWMEFKHFTMRAGLPEDGGEKGQVPGQHCFT